jgi:hypothetical protein
MIRLALTMSTWLMAGGAALVLSACAERTLDDEVEQFCRDGCERTMRCDAIFDDKTLEQCVQDCIPPTKKGRDKCEALFDLSVCGSQLTCDESAEYEDVLEHADGEREYQLDYPCAAENVRYIEECLKD